MSSILYAFLLVIVLRICYQLAKPHLDYESYHPEYYRQIFYGSCVAGVLIILMFI